MERARRVNNVRNANMTIEATTPKRGGGGGSDHCDGRRDRTNQEHRRD